MTTRGKNVMHRLLRVSLCKCVGLYLPHLTTVVNVILQTCCDYVFIHVWRRLAVRKRMGINVSYNKNVFYYNFTLFIQLSIGQKYTTVQFIFKVFSPQFRFLPEIMLLHASFPVSLFLLLSPHPPQHGSPSLGGSFTPATLILNYVVQTLASPRFVLFKSCCTSWSRDGWVFHLACWLRILLASLSVDSLLISPYSNKLLVLILTKIPTNLS